MGYSPWAHRELDMTEQLTLCSFLVNLDFYANFNKSRSIRAAKTKDKSCPLSYFR